MIKKLRISLIFSNLVVTKSLSSNRHIHNLYTKFVKILEICKQFSENLVNERGNVPRRGPIPKFSVSELERISEGFFDNANKFVGLTLFLVFLGLLAPIDMHFFRLVPPEKHLRVTREMDY